MKLLFLEWKLKEEQFHAPLTVTHETYRTVSQKLNQNQSELNSTSDLEFPTLLQL